MRAALLIAASLWLGGVSAALACTPVAFGTFKVGERVDRARLLGIPGTCNTPNECVFNERTGIEYVWSRGVIAEVSAPVRIVRGLPVPLGRIDAAYLRRVNRASCQVFRLKRDEGGEAYLESPERVDPVTRRPIRSTIYFDERRTPLIAITSLPEN